MVVVVKCNCDASENENETKQKIVQARFNIIITQNRNENGSKVE